MIDNEMVGKYVVVRCHDAGVHAGVLEAHEGRECVLTEARRLWYWKVKKGTGDFLSAIANHGLGSDCKIGEAVARIHLTEDCEIILCSSESETSIRDYPVHGKS